VDTFKTFGNQFTVGLFVNFACAVISSSILISDICSAASKVATHELQHNPAKQQMNIKWWAGRLLSTEKISAAVITSISY
jgi:hypothetical protein